MKATDSSRSDKKMPVISFTVEKAVTRRDLMKLHFRYFFRTSMVKWLFLLSLVPFLAGVTFNLLTSYFSAGPLIFEPAMALLLLIPVFFFVVMLLNLLFFTARKMKTNEEHFTNVTYRLDEDGFLRLHGKEEFYHPWSEFCEWSENDRFFFVIMCDKQRSLHFIPKWGLKSEAEEEALRQILERYVISA